MKKLIVALMVLTSLVSCGKNNSVGSVGGAGGTVTNPLVINNTSAQALVSMIANPSTGFGQGVIYNNSTSQNCGTTLFGLLQYCTYGGGATQTGITWNSLMASNSGLVFQYSPNRTIRNNIDVTIATQQAALSSILNSATSIQVNGPIYYVQVSGAQYVIDTRLPIQANPAATRSPSISEYFVQAI